ncbi:MAG: hypothetical protein L6R41_006893 [Letrouitia leprolyta]|nr:MAG: hypothetical protein L6R41_006893 [Letrouitia leprolyta]
MAGEQHSCGRGKREDVRTIRTMTIVGEVEIVLEAIILVMMAETLPVTRNMRTMDKKAVTIVMAIGRNLDHPALMHGPHHPASLVPAPTQDPGATVYVAPPMGTVINGQPYQGPFSGPNLGGHYGGFGGYQGPCWYPAPGYTGPQPPAQFYGSVYEASIPVAYSPQVAQQYPQQYTQPVFAHFNTGFTYSQAPHSSPSPPPISTTPASCQEPTVPQGGVGDHRQHLFYKLRYSYGANFHYIAGTEVEM